MGEEDIVRMELPAGSQYLRLARLVAGGIGVVAGFDVEHVDDLRIAVDELCSALVEVGDGSVIELQFAINGSGVEVEGRTPVTAAAAFDADRLGLSRQILAVACDDFSLTIDDGVAGFRMRKQPAA